MQLKPLLKNTFAAAASDGLSRLLGFVATAYLARVLGTSSFGVISIGLSVLGYAILFSSPGVTTLGMREVARAHDSAIEFVHEITSLRLALSSLALFVAFAVGLILFNGSGSVVIVVLFAASVVPISLSVEWYFQGKNRIVDVAASRVMMYCCYLALVLLLVRTPGDMLWTPVAFWIGNLIPAAWLTFLFWRTVGPIRFSWNLSRWNHLLKASFPLGLSSLLMQSIVNLPILIAGSLLTAHETGLFSASMKLLFFVLMIDRVFNTLFFPVISRYRLHNEPQFRAVAVSGLKVIVAVSLPIAIIGAAFAPTFTSLVYGPLYHDAGSILQWLLPYFVFTTTNTVLMCILYADKRDTDVLVSLTIGTASLVILCVLLGLLWRGEGIAAGLTAGEGMITLLLFSKVGSTVNLRSARMLGPIAVSGILMALGMVLMRDMNPAVAALLGAAMFLVVLFALKGMTVDDIRFLREKFV